MAQAADLNLLFGILALQMDFVTRDALIAAMHAWVLDKDKPLGRILRRARGPGRSPLSPCWNRWSPSTWQCTAAIRSAAWPPRSPRGRSSMTSGRSPTRTSRPPCRMSRPTTRPYATHRRRGSARDDRPAAADSRFVLLRPLRRGGARRGLRGPRPGAEPRGGPEGDPGPPRRRPRQPCPVPARGRDHRRPGAPRHRPGLRPGARTPTAGRSTPCGSSAATA